MVLISTMLIDYGISTTAAALVLEIVEISRFRLFSNISKVTAAVHTCNYMALTSLDRDIVVGCLTVI